MATSTLATLLIKIEANSAQAVSALSATEKRYKALGSLVARLAPVIGFGAIAREVVKNSIIQQNALAQLEAAVRSTGGAAGKSVAELDAYSNALQQTTTYANDAIEGVQSLLLTFKEIKGGTFDRATRAILDMSTAMGQDLKSSVIQVGKALNDPILGVTALQRVGVQFSKSQREVIKSLVETGKVAEAQAIILKELESQFGGSAEAARNTLGGALAFLKNQWGDLFEVSKEGSAGIVSAINAVGEAIPRIREKFDGFVESVKTLVYWYKSVRRELALWEAASTKYIPGMADRYAELLRQAADLKQEIHDMFNPRVRSNAEGYASAVGNIASNAEDAAAALAKVSVTIGDPTAVAIGAPSAVNPGLLEGRGFQLTASFKPEAKALESAFSQTTRNLMRYADQFADSFAGAIAMATREGMESFRRFGDFVVQELLRIGIKKLLINTFTSAVGGATAQAAGGASAATAAAASPAKISMAPGMTAGLKAPATVVNQTVNFTVSAIDSKDAAKFIEQQKGSIAKVVADAARNSSGFRSAMAGG